MKVIGQSTLADGSPYLHLGYTAATTLVLNKPWRDGGIVLLVAGAVFALRILQKRTAEGQRSWHIGLSRRKRWILAGMACIGTSVVFFRISSRTGKMIHDYPEEFTRWQAQVALGAMVHVESEGKSGKEAIPAVREYMRQQSGSDVVDGWFHDMRLLFPANSGDEYIVLSAGPDGVFDTPDDIKFAASRSDLISAAQPATTRPAKYK